MGSVIANVTKIPANSDRDRNGGALSPQVHPTFQDHALEGEHLKDKCISSKQVHAVNSTSPHGSPNPPYPSHLDQPENANLSDSYSNDVDMLNTCSSLNATPRHSSSVEDGEVRDLQTPIKVRELLVPLMLQNASGRMSAARHAGPQPMSLDMDTLTDKVCSSFQEKVKDLRKSMDSSSVENQTNIPLVDAHHGYRHLPNAHEYHSPEPHIGQRFVSPSRHITHHRSPSNKYKYRLPPNAHEYHSPEPPSPRPRSPRRLRSSASASQSHVFPDKKYWRSPDSRSRSPYESARQTRGAYRGRRRWDDYPIRRSASPRLRRPYEPYSSNRRGSRSPRRRSQSSDSQMSDRLPASRYSPDRRPRTKKILDNDLSSQSTSKWEPSRNTQEGPSEDIKTTCTTKPLANTEQNVIEETTTPEHKHVLPCHHVPGLWFVKVALNDIGTLECSFEIDSETAIKWKFSGIKCVFLDIHFWG